MRTDSVLWRNSEMGKGALSEAKQPSFGSVGTRSWEKVTPVMTFAGRGKPETALWAVHPSTAYDGAFFNAETKLVS